MPFINANERCNTTDIPFHMSGNNISNVHVHRIQFMILEDKTNITTQRCITGRHFTAATHSLNTSCSKLNQPEKKESPMEARLQFIKGDEKCHTKDAS